MLHSAEKTRGARFASWAPGLSSLLARAQAAGAERARLRSLPKFPASRLGFTTCPDRALDREIGQTLKAIERGNAAWSQPLEIWVNSSRSSAMELPSTLDQAADSHGFFLARACFNACSDKGTRSRERNLCWRLGELSLRRISRMRALPKAQCVERCSERPASFLLMRAIHQRAIRPALLPQQRFALESWGRHFEDLVRLGLPERPSPERCADAMEDAALNALSLLTLNAVAPDEIPDAVWETLAGAIRSNARIKSLGANIGWGSAHERLASMVDERAMLEGVGVARADPRAAIKKAL